MNNTKALEAQSRINQAQEDEAKARKAGNPLAVDEAVARKTRAEDDLYAALQPEHEETVTLLALNPEANRNGRGRGHVRGRRGRRGAAVAGRALRPGV